MQIFKTYEPTYARKADYLMQAKNCLKWRINLCYGNTWLKHRTRRNVYQFLPINPHSLENACLST